MSARSLLLNGLMQNDLDADNHKILNLDTSNLNVGGPITQPPVIHQWLKSYDANTRLFGLTQPDILDLTGFPVQTGHAGDFLSTNGLVLSFSRMPVTYINVKSPPYNAVGDGVADDYPAINQALIDAAGRTVYFPAGFYLVKSNLAPTGICTLVGDGARNSIIRGWTGRNGNIITLGIGSVVRNLGVDGSLAAVTEPVKPDRYGIALSAPPGASDLIVTDGVTIFNCRVINCAGIGIKVLGASNGVIAFTEIDNCGFDGILAENSPRTSIFGCKVSRCTERGIRLINSPQSFIKDNSVSSCGLVTPGMEVLDSDNTVIQGNRIQQCAFGLNVLSSAGRGMQSYGMSIVGNVIVRNYVSGARITLSHGFSFSGNTVADNGQGGTDNIIQTVEPGICVDISNPGTGYQVGDVLTLVGGSGVAAKVYVKKIFAGGALSTGDPLSNDALHPLSLGAYTTLPTNPVSVTGGHGSGVKVLFSGAKLVNPGTGYVAGEVLRSTNGVFTNPVRIMITKVGTGGIVIGFEILDGGGYKDITLPTNVLVFTPDSLSDNQGTGTGLTVTPAFARRYSANFNGATIFGLSLLGNIFGGIIGNNVIDTTRAGVGVLVQEGVSPNNVRANHLTIVGNSLINNTFAFAGQTIGSPIDPNYNFNSVIANNVIYPSGTIDPA